MTTKNFDRNARIFIVFCILVTIVVVIIGISGLVILALKGCSHG